MAFLLLLSSCSTVHYEAYPETSYKRTYAIASWYGPKFHGRPTASGEIFNMYEYTCAHKVYPFGTMVKVTYLKNEKTVECVVNDRGPFVKGRDIDLSYASAKRIGLIGPGTGRVLLEVQGRNNSYIKRVKVQTFKKTGPFAIQVASFKDGINAIRLKAVLKLRYSNVYIQEANIRGTKYHRVIIGDFENFNNAISLAEQLGQEGYQTLIIKAEVRL